MMTEVHTVSIVAKNTYIGKVGSRKSPSVRGRTKVRKPLVRVITPPAMIFASRFALDASSRDARIMAMVFPSRPLNPAEPIVADLGLNSATQRKRTGQARPHTGSLVTRRATIETTAPFCRACKPPAERVTGVGFYRDFGRQLSQTGVGVEKVCRQNIFSDANALFRVLLPSVL